MGSALPPGSQAMEIPSRLQDWYRHVHRATRVWMLCLVPYGKIARRHMMTMHWNKSCD